MAYTPGPWRLWLSPDDRGAFRLYGDSPEPYGANMVIADRSIGTPNGDEGIANAQLIAAAPALYEALKALVNEVRGQVALAEPEIRAAIGNTNMACVEHRLTLATAALAQAEGHA